MRRASDGESGRFALNVASNIGFAVMNVALMLWYVPFLLQHLGLAAFGVIPLANTLVMYTTILSASLDTSVTRFLAMDLNRSDESAANRTFNAAVILSLVSSAALLLLCLAIAGLLPALFNLPAGLETGTRYVFGGVAATMLTGILGCSFSAISVVMHRFELRNLVRALTALSRVGVVALCFALWSPSLWHVALGFVVSAVVQLTGDILVARRLAPGLRFDLRSADQRQVVAMTGFSGWSSVNQVGNLLMLQVDLLLVNLLFGAEATGRLGALLLLVVVINSMTETVVTVLSPLVMARYVEGDQAALQRFVVRSVRLLGVALALPIGLLCGLGSPMLRLWLGPEFTSLDLLLTLLVGHLAVSLACRPLSYVLMAHNRVRLQSVVTLAAGIVAIPLAVGLASWADWGIAGVVAATAAMWVARNVLFLAPYAARTLGLRATSFLASLAIIAGCTVGVGLASAVVDRLLHPSSWTGLAGAAALVTLVYLVVAYALALDRSDRRFVRGALWRMREGVPG
ncbi:hypothetical protein JMJ56_24525 [Belnapia sp. T18]|uniref:Membrane protein involved in the export of O-antigen and teichoic acid n=1 Tax=Belnapia arida TaxID=2804533 RepID=A0ABS1U919_9PROT|nr:hypothetical protein [Belnapia arida]MBL6081170.1 hypothetical protein [Belnapia arida]